jgi:hypothetical protein
LNVSKKGSSVHFHVNRDHYRDVTLDPLQKLYLSVHVPPQATFSHAPTLTPVRADIVQNSGRHWPLGSVILLAAAAGTQLIYNLPRRTSSVS